MPQYSLNRNSQIQQFFTLMPKLQITIVPKEIGQLWDELLDDVLHDVCNVSAEVPNLPLSELIPHTYHPNYNVYHGKCHKQHTTNLCGYHATFNILCFLNFIKRGHSSYDILSGGSFWRFKRRVEEFLFGIKKQYKLADEWPWRQNDIIHGDFQRTYNKVCVERFQDFQIFRNHDQFELYSFTWQFQFENLMMTDDKKRQLNKLIQYFKQYKSAKPLVLSFMLAITNHWMCLQAVKVGNQTQYWFFDSTNRDFLDLSEEGIKELIEKIVKQRAELKKQPYSAFYLSTIPVRYKDTQISLKLIIDCLEGKTTVDKYIYNQQFNIFAKHLEEHWDNDIKLFQHTLKQYWHNITTFFRSPVLHGLFTPENSRKFYKFVEVLRSIKGESDEGKRLYSLVKKYDIMTSI